MVAPGNPGLNRNSWRRFAKSTCLGSNIRTDRFSHVLFALGFPVAITYSHLRSIVQQKVASLLAIASGTVASYVTPQTTIRTRHTSYL
jgi:hypothetical protein